MVHPIYPSDRFMRFRTPPPPSDYAYRAAAFGIFLLLADSRERGKNIQGAAWMAEKEMGEITGKTPVLLGYFAGGGRKNQIANHQAVVGAGAGPERTETALKWLLIQIWSIRKSGRDSIIVLPRPIPAPEKLSRKCGLRRLNTPLSAGALKSPPRITGPSNEISCITFSISCRRNNRFA